MIDKAEIINQPYPGEFKERIYDHQSPWNSQSWTWIKFLNEDFSEWCGEFRGQPKHVAISRKYNVVLVLTSDYLFQLDRDNGDIMEIEDRPQYKELTSTPSGNFILADLYNIEFIESTIKNKKMIESPVKMDMIQFIGWQDNKLFIACDEFLNWDNHLILELDPQTLKIKIKNNT